MNRLFRTSTPGKSGWLALALFVAGYLVMMGLVVAPQHMLRPASMATVSR